MSLKPPPLPLPQISEKSAEAASHLSGYKSFASCCFRPPYKPPDISESEARDSQWQAKLVPLPCPLRGFWVLGHSVNELGPLAANVFWELTCCATI